MNEYCKADSDLNMCRSKDYGTERGKKREIVIEPVPLNVIAKVI